MAQQGIRELTAQELSEVAGGDLNWSAIGIGIGMIGLGITVASTGGIALVPLSVFGAAYATDLILAGTALALAGGGGFMIGAGACW